MNIDNIKLSSTNVKGGGRAIYASFGKTFDCVEYTLSDKPQPIVIGRSQDELLLLGYAPFVQFSPKEFEETMDTIYKEIVSLWNEKHGHKIPENNT